ncbi:sterile alpha motif domain-containing protein 3-like [Alosa alosa]|nr:sterile alpha motif domain-containing protein 3-like [Alosa alosa]
MAHLWSVSQVCEWLEEAGLGHAKDTFIENEVDGLTLTKMTERMSERMFPKMKDQVQFMAALDKLKLGDSHDAEVRAETPVMPVSPVSSDVILPPFLNSALSSQDPQFKSQGKNKLKNALIQALFDHLSQKTMYPSHTQYVLTLRSTLIRFPFLREKYGSGYDALLESLRNKFKKERRPLVNLEEVFKMKEKYSARHSGVETEEVCLQKRSCEQEVSLDSAEDLRSILQHIEVLQQEHHKARPSFDIILQRLDRTKTYRQHYIQNHTTAEVLKEFPCLMRPNILLGEMKRIYQIDADKTILTKMGELAPKLLEKAPKGTE